MPLSPVSITGGLARLGEWGTLELSGATSAVLRLKWTADVEIPESLAPDLTGGVLLLNDRLGRLLLLPYAGELVVAYDLREGETLYPPIVIPRHADYGLRMAAVRVMPDDGAIHLTESTLARFSEDCSLAWRQDDDFAGWSIEGVGLETVNLIAGDWSGVEQRQSRSLASGSRLE
ncbi:MAG: hypothetical protein ACR2H3_02515 [Acidimicrobiales bacterium]